MIKNYFSDITDLFLKIKREENIQINEEAKAEIREMLQAKIIKIKDDAIQNAQIDDSLKQPFWVTWRYQLFGIPASLFALVLIVFITSNLKVSIPKEDFSPTRENTANKTVVETAKQTESDRPLVKTAPGLMVIDFSEDNKNSRSLNDFSVTTVTETITQDQAKQEENVFRIPRIEYSNGQIFIVSEKTETASTPVDSLDAEIPADQATTQTSATQIPQTSDTTTIDTIKSLDTSIPVTTTAPLETPTAESLDTNIPTTTTPLNTNISATAIAPNESLNIITPELIPETILPQIVYPVYTYRDETLKTQPAFTKENLAKLTKSKTPESVTVYYVGSAQVVVEIEEAGITKWYLFDNIKGTWIISKYEKFVTDNVVK